MFLEYYGLMEQPFGVTPDGRFLYLGPKHREALASLIYGTESNRGFLALIAKPGMGKTSLLYQYLELLRGRARTVYVFQTDCGPRALLRQILSDLGVSTGGKSLHDALNEALREEMQAGRLFVLVIDEAQGLNREVLESVRLLSNFETQTTKLMQIVMAGQPQLAEQLAKSSLMQLRQRISSVIRLEPFTPEETNAYIDHRLSVAGYQGPTLFTVGARRLIAEHSRGIPRNINNLCFNAMSLAYAMNKKQIDSGMVSEVISDLAIETLLPEAEARARSSPSNSSGRPFASLDLMPSARKAGGLSTRATAIALLASVVILGSAFGVISWNQRMLKRTRPSAAAAPLPLATATEKVLTLGTPIPAVNSPPGVVVSPVARSKSTNPLDRTVPRAQ
jgi:general secretion pathway protein A